MTVRANLSTYMHRPHIFAEADGGRDESSTATSSGVPLSRGTSDQSLEREAVESERSPRWAQFERLVEHLSDGVTVQDTSGRLVYANEAGARLSGYSTPGELLDAPVGDFLSRFEVLSANADPVPIESLPGRIALYGRASTAELLVRDRRTGAERWSEVRSYPVLSEDGTVQFVVNIFRDTTESVRHRRLLEDQAQELEEQTAQAQALAEELEQSNEELADALRLVEDAHRREEHLSRATAILASSLDYETTLRRVAELSVPELGDWCSVDLLGVDGGVQQLAVAHVDPEKVRWARALRAKATPDMASATGLPKVLRTGEPEFYPVITDDLLVQSARDADELDVMRAVGFSSALIVPIRAEGIVGALTLVWAETRKQYSKIDLTFATELGRRAGMAIERASNYREAVIARAEAENARAASAERAAWLAKLQDLTLALSRTRSTRDVQGVAMNQGRESFGAASAYLALVDETSNYIDLTATSGLSQEVAERYQRFPITAPIPSAECVRSGRPVLVEDDATFFARFPELDAVRRDTGTQATAAFPLRVGGSVMGTLVFSYESSHPFSEDYVRAARTFAKEVGQAWDRARSREELVVAKTTAEAATSAKSTFLSTMSHELRTPINAILGYSELIRTGVAGPITEAQSSYLARIRASTDHLLDLINDILDLAKIESGQVEVGTEASDASVVIRESADLIDGEARSRGLDFTYACSDGILYVGDPRRVRQILLNLLSNAVKFTTRGGKVRLSCSMHDAEDGKPWVAFTVEDSGIGIRSEELSRMFEAFAQGEQTYTREHGGTGLGLTISRRLARLMGGDVTATSVVGKGSRFTLALPASAGSASNSRLTNVRD